MPTGIYYFILVIKQKKFIVLCNKERMFDNIKMKAHRLLGNFNKKGFPERFPKSGIIFTAELHDLVIGNHSFTIL